VPNACGLRDRETAGHHAGRVSRHQQAEEKRVHAGILELVAAAETDADFGVLGAAIMEMFVADDDDRSRWLEEQATASEPFRRSLANVRVWGDLRDEVSARVEGAAGVRLARPRGWTGP